MHKCVMVKIGGRKNRELSKKPKFCGNRGTYRFCGNRGKFINFVEVGGWAIICIIGLGGMDAPDYAHCDLIIICLLLGISAL